MSHEYADGTPADELAQASARNADTCKHDGFSHTRNLNCPRPAPETEEGPEPCALHVGQDNGCVHGKPAAPTPEQVECPSCKHWVDMPTPGHPPWAPEPAPDMPDDERARIDSYMGQPAAPEPSAEHVSPAMLAEFEMGKEQRDKLRAALESAEAQLAAVKAQCMETRHEAEKYTSVKYRDAVQAMGFNAIDELLHAPERLLTPEPSPGAGEKT